MGIIKFLINIDQEEVGLSNNQTDDIIDELHNMGLIKNWGDQNTSDFGRKTRD